MQYVSKRGRELIVEIVYEDNHLLAAIKPAGMPAQEDKSGKADLLRILKDYRQENEGKPGEAWLGLLHRLDQPVSGLMLFAKTSKAAARMSEEFRQRRVGKTYHCVVRGTVPLGQGEWHDHISAAKNGGRYVLCSPEVGKSCNLSYTCIAQQPKPALSLLEIQLGTGRSHQIRVQCQGHGHPIVGDRRYGHMDAFDASYAAPALRATALTFVHPVSKELISLSIGLEKELPWAYFSELPKPNIS